MDSLERTDARPTLSRRAQLAGLLLGGSILAAGWFAARTWLPEWQLPVLPAPEAFVTAFRETARQVGVEITAEPQVKIEDGRFVQHNPYVVFGGEATAWIAERKRPILFRVSAAATAPEAGAVEFRARYGLDRRPWEITFVRAGWGAVRPLWDTAFPDARRLLLDPGESLGSPVRRSFFNSPVLVAEVQGSGHPEALQWFESFKTNTWNVSRLPGSAEQTGRAHLRPALLKTAFLVVLVLAVLVAVLVLLVRRRIDFVNAAFLTGVSVVFGTLAAFLLAPGGRQDGFGFALFTTLSSVFLFTSWAAGESWLRATGQGTSRAFDALRSGRVGRRVGAAMLWGLGVGAAAGGWLLLIHGVATWVPGGVPEVSTVSLPMLHSGSTPFDLGFATAALALLGLAVGRHFAVGRRAWGLSILVGGILSLPVLSTVRPVPLALLLSFGFVALLNLAFARAGSLALAVAGLASYLLPQFLFALQSPEWLGSGLWTSATLLVGLGALGFVGSFRPEVVPELVPAPVFVRRIEEEKRLQYETELLARIQEGLLPERLPELAGWEFAARTIQAHEVGGDFYDFFRAPDGALWIAAGDVAGHGISCSITHAMTKAALASLIRSGETPARVLGEVDRVLRTLTTSRLFSSLALVRLELETGHGLLSNAGYPYPLQREGREVKELVVPGLPVGEGPSRRYQDLEIAVPPGGILLFYSDGLAEALRPDGEPYGFDRPRQVFAAAPARSAADILGAFTTDWHREVGERSEDDTTLLVVRRRG